MAESSRATGFFLKWNNYYYALVTLMHSLIEVTKLLVDVWIADEVKFINFNLLVLVASSPYLEVTCEVKINHVPHHNYLFYSFLQELLEQCDIKPDIILQNVKFDDLKLLVQVLTLIYLFKFTSKSYLFIISTCTREKLLLWKLKLLSAY